MIVRKKVTHVALIPALAQLWLQAREWENSDLSSLSVIQVGGERLNPTLAEKIITTIGGILQQVFGMAEGLLCYIRLEDSRSTVLNTQGCSLSPYDEARIIDEDENNVLPSKMGQLLTRGPYTKPTTRRHSPLKDFIAPETVCAVINGEICSS